MWVNAEERNEGSGEGRMSLCFRTGRWRRQDRGRRRAEWGRCPAGGRAAVLGSECVVCVSSKEPRTRSGVGGESRRGEVRSRRPEGPVRPCRAWQAGPRRGLSSPRGPCCACDLKWCSTYEPGPVGAGARDHESRAGVEGQVNRRLRDDWLLVLTCPSYTKMADV